MTPTQGSLGLSYADLVPIDADEPADVESAGRTLADPDDMKDQRTSAPDVPTPSGDGHEEAPDTTPTPRQKRTDSTRIEGTRIEGAPRCARCGRPLSDPDSVRRGVGPICWKKLNAPRSGRAANGAAAPGVGR